MHSVSSRESNAYLYVVVCERQAVTLVNVISLIQSSMHQALVGQAWHRSCAAGSGS